MIRCLKSSLFVLKFVMSLLESEDENFLSYIYPTFPNLLKHDLSGHKKAKHDAKVCFNRFFFRVEHIKDAQIFWPKASEYINIYP